MFHLKISSPLWTAQGKKRRTNSGRSSVGSAKKCHRNVETPPAEPVPIRYSDNYKRKKAQTEMGMMPREKTIYPIAPDAHIPNSTCRTVFKPEEVKPIVVKEFEIRMDILNNLENKKNRYSDDEDEDWTELGDPDSVSNVTTSKISKATLISRSKNKLPDLFKRLQEEPWWNQPKEDQPNLQAILTCLFEILRAKKNDSYESACYYVVEIFRTYGIAQESVDEILKILLQHLITSGNDPLNICTIRTISQFMIERKHIIVTLLDLVRKYRPNDPFRLEIINAVKYITDVNDSDEIDLVLDHMFTVYDTPDEDFSLKMIIQELKRQRKLAEAGDMNEDDESNEIHPLLKKISEERWFPRNNVPITLDYVLDTIILKLLDTGKSLIKTLTTHLVQIHRVIGYNKEQFDRAANGLISLLAHTDADYRLLAATNLANLERETKTIDLALLNYFLNDSRILVRTECGETLKKLTGITSDTVLQDCANDISFLETLPEQNFSLQNYLRKKNGLPTPSPVLIEESTPIPVIIERPLSSPSDVEEKEHEEISIVQEEQVIITAPYKPKEEIIPRPVSPYVNLDQFRLPIQTESTDFSQVPSITSTMTPVPPAIRVEINGKSDAPPMRKPRSRLEKSASLSVRSTKRAPSPTRVPSTERTNRKRSSLVPNNSNMWDSYVKQNKATESKDTPQLPLNDFPPIKEEQPQDFIQTIIEEHKQSVGFYRMASNRRILIPHKITMEDALAEQSHIIVAQYFPSPPPLAKQSMTLSDLQHNRQHLIEVESVQLLASLVIRTIQVHRQYEKFIPTLNSPSFVTALSVSAAPMHESSNTSVSSVKLPSIIPQRLTAKQFAHVQSSMQAKAAKEGINVSKAQHMESALSGLLKSKRESIKSTTLSSSTSQHSTTKHIDVNHAWLLVQLLRSQGVFNPESSLQKIIQTYPKFIPILNTRIPQNLLPLIWNDPVTQQLVSIFNNREEQSSPQISSIKRGDAKSFVGIADDDSKIDALDYSTLINRVQNKKRFLPVIRGFKVNPPPHVVKFGYQEIDMISPEPTSNSLFDENISKSRKRRVCMHLMMPSNENMLDRQKSMRSQLSHMINTDYSTPTYVPIVPRPSICH